MTGLKTVDYSIGREFDAMLKERTTFSRWMHQDMTAGEGSRGGFGTGDQNELLSRTPMKSRREDVDQDHLGFQPGGRNYEFALHIKSSQVHGKKSGSNDQGFISANVVRHSSSAPRSKHPSAADELAARIIKSRLELSYRMGLVTAPEIRDPEPSPSDEPTRDCIVSPETSLSNQPISDCIVSGNSDVETDVDQTGCNALDEVYASAWNGVAIVGSGIVGWCKCDAFHTGSLAFTQDDTDEAKASSPLSSVEALPPTFPNGFASAETKSHPTTADAIVDAIQMAREEAHALAADTAVIIDSINLSDAFEMAQEEAALLLAETAVNFETTGKASEWGFESGVGASTSPSDAIRGSQMKDGTFITTMTEKSSGKTIATAIEPAREKAAHVSAGPAQAHAENREPSESDLIVSLNDFPPQDVVESLTTSMTSLLTE